MDLLELLDDWMVSLRSARKSPATLKTYRAGVDHYARWAAAAGLPAVLTKRQVSVWVADQLDAGAEPATARARQLAVRRFSAWLADEGEIPADELLGMKPPKLDEKVIEPLTDDDVRALVAACKGDRFQDKRDEAILRLMLETGLRASEAVSLALDDVDTLNGVAIVRRGKGFKGRTVAFGPQTSESINRYKRKRRAHKRADSSALWLGERGQGFGYSALWKQLQYRASLAGIGAVNPHKLRHTYASRWLAAGGSEGGLMSQAGWAKREMLDRYSKATAGRRAGEEARKLGLGEL